MHVPVTVQHSPTFCRIVFGRGNTLCFAISAQLTRFIFYSVVQLNVFSSCWAQFDTERPSRRQADRNRIEIRKKRDEEKRTVFSLCIDHVKMKKKKERNETKITDKEEK